MSQEIVAARFTGADWVIMDYIPTIVRQHDEIAPYVNAVIQIDLSGAGAYYFDFTQGRDSNVHRGKHNQPDCIVEMHVDEFCKLMVKDPMALVESYLDGKVMVHGNMIAFTGLSVLFDHIKVNRFAKFVVALFGMKASIKLFKKFL